MKPKIDRILNIFIVILIVMIIGLITMFVVRQHQNNSAYNQRVSSSSISKDHSKKKSKKSNDDNDSYDQNKNSQEDYSENTSMPSSTEQSSNGVIVQDGPNFSYRAAQKLGLIPNQDTYTSVQDFYKDCQDDGNGGFTYKGKRYVGRVIQDGHQDEYHCNIEVTPAD